MKRRKFTHVILTLLIFSVIPTSAQRVLTLEECRDLALENNKNLKISEEKVAMANYDKKAAVANYFPNISAQGVYMHNSRNIQLLNDKYLGAIQSVGEVAQSGVQSVSDLLSSILSNPDIYQYIIQNPALLQALTDFQNGLGVADALAELGAKIDDILTVDISNVWAGMISVQEPLYVGGKIRAYNKIAAYAKELAASQLSTSQQEIIVNTDKAYWQIVSVANKVKLTEAYTDLLRKMNSDVDKMVDEGVATVSDRLSVRVKLNEAEMMLLKAQNGLDLSKMLLCQYCGLALDSDITLADETIEDVIIPAENLEYTEDDIMNNRSELVSLSTAKKIYDKKVNIVRADYLPTIAAFGNYALTNPSCFNGFQKEFGGMWNFGVVAKIPLFHFGEGYNKIRKAKSEAKIMSYQLEDTKELILLQVSQYEKQISESDARMKMSEEKMNDAEENLRMANLGFKEGIVTSSVLNAAQTAWLQAHSEYIDSKIDRIMAGVYLKKAIGALN